MTGQRETLLAKARAASANAYAPYSQFHVGAALAFADGAVISASNAENASYGLTLCAETVAVGMALAQGRRGGLVAVAVSGGPPGADGTARPGADPVTPCGRCRQMLSELAGLDGADPVIWCDSATGGMEVTLSQLLPHAFGPKAIRG